MTATPNASHEVYALRYATRADSTASENFYRFELYDEPDEQVRMDYFFWLIRNETHTVLVDCAYSEERAAERNRGFTSLPVDLLARVDVRPEDVDHVVLSHMHFDHIGNVGLFPNATFSTSRAELDFWTGPFSDRPCIQWAIAPTEVRDIQQLGREGRLYLTDGGADEIFPGIRLTTLPGHTPGQLVVEVDTPRDRVVLASDAAHFYDEIERDRPFHIFTDLEGMYRTYAELRSIGARPATTVVAGHDPAVMRMFETVADEVVDLTRPLEG